MYDVLASGLVDPFVMEEAYRQARISSMRSVWKNMRCMRRKGHHCFKDGPVRYYLGIAPGTSRTSNRRYAMRPAKNYLAARVHDVDTICRFYSKDEILQMVEAGKLRKTALAVILEDSL